MPVLLSGLDATLWLPKLTGIKFAGTSARQAAALTLYLWICLSGTVKKSTFHAVFTADPNVCA
jgi:hypothetical protein